MPVPTTQASAIDPAQAHAAALASLLNGVNPPPDQSDPNQLTAPTLMDPTQQQVADVQSAPIQQQYHHYVQAKQARSGAGGMVANRRMAQTPFAQHVQQSNQYGTGQYADSPYAGMQTHPNAYTTMTMPTGAEAEAQATARGSGPQYTQAQDIAEHPTEDFGTIAQNPMEMAKVQEQAAATHAKAMDESQRTATAYQDSLQGIGKSGNTAASQRADTRLQAQQAKSIMKEIESKPEYQAFKGSKMQFDPSKLTDDDAAQYQSAKALTQSALPTGARDNTAGKGQSTQGVKAIQGHEEGQILNNPKTGKNYVVQNGVYVEQ